MLESTFYTCNGMLMHTKKDSKTRKMPHVRRICELPDDILVYVLSHLPLKEAGMTSIISKRWRHLWEYVPTLTFDASDLLYYISISNSTTTLEIETLQFVGNVPVTSHEKHRFNELPICFMLSTIQNFGYITGSYARLKRKSLVCITTGSHALDELLGVKGSVVIDAVPILSYVRDGGNSHGGSHGGGGESDDGNEEGSEEYNLQDPKNFVSDDQFLQIYVHEPYSEIHDKDCMRVRIELYILGDVLLWRGLHDHELERPYHHLSNWTSVLNSFFHCVGLDDDDLYVYGLPTRDPPDYIRTHHPEFEELDQEQEAEEIIMPSPTDRVIRPDPALLPFGLRNVDQGHPLSLYTVGLKNVSAIRISSIGRVERLSGNYYRGVDAGRVKVFLW